MQLEGKRILITGAGSGIGRALALEAAARGARLALAGRRREALEETASQLTAAETLVIASDVCAAAGREGLRQALSERWGGLDVLVNCAGSVGVGALARCSDAELERMLQTNLLAPMALSRELLPLLQRSVPARIVNIGSVFGDIGYPLFAAYSASKFGLRGFSMALRRELAGSGIGVTYAAPRATQTAAASAFAELVAPLGMRLDPPQRVASLVWDAVARDADSVYPRGAERLFVLVQRLLPGLVDRAIARQLRDPRVRPLTALPPLRGPR